MKRVSIILTVFSLVAALLTMAAAPKAGGTATLIGAGYVEGKGVVFTFHVEGKFSKSDLKGRVHVDGGGDYDLDCVKADGETVRCTAQRAVAGHNVVVTWGGAVFWTFVPEVPYDPEYCYAIYDWNLDVPATDWVNAGTYCQDNPAAYGDLIVWFNPAWGAEFIYEFLPESPNQDWCPYNQTGDAFYFPICDPSWYDPGL